MTLTGNFHEFSAEIRFFLIWSQIQVPKTGRFKKKIHQNNRSRTDFMVDFLNYFWKKNRKFLKKNFFESCYFIFKHGEKKKFFFWKFFRPRFRPKFWKCIKRVEIANLQLSTWNFFEPYFHTQRNVLNTW